MNKHELGQIVMDMLGLRYHYDPPGGYRNVQIIPNASHIRPRNSLKE